MLTDEPAEFALPGDPKAFRMPSDYGTNEYPYTIPKRSAVDSSAQVRVSTAMAVREVPDA